MYISNYGISTIFKFKMLLKYLPNTLPIAYNIWALFRPASVFKYICEITPNSITRDSMEQVANGGVLILRKRASYRWSVINHS